MRRDLKAVPFFLPPAEVILLAPGDAPVGGGEICLVAHYEEMIKCAGMTAEHGVLRIIVGVLTRERRNVLPGGAQCDAAERGTQLA